MDFYSIQANVINVVKANFINTIARVAGEYSGNMPIALITFEYE